MSLAEHRRTLAHELVAFLEASFTEYIGDQTEWWQSHVLNELTLGQLGAVRSRRIERLGQLDLHALLRVFDRNWGELNYWCRLTNDVCRVCWTPEKQYLPFPPHPSKTGPPKAAFIIGKHAHDHPSATIYMLSLLTCIPTIHTNEHR